MAEKLIPAPLDNKNLVEDCLEDDVFGNFYAGYTHRNLRQYSGKHRHLIGYISKDDKDFYFDSIVDVSWFYGENKVDIKVLAAPGHEDFDEMCKSTLDYFEFVFKQWENPDNENLRVMFERSGNSLFVYFFFVND